MIKRIEDCGERKYYFILPRPPNCTSMTSKCIKRKVAKINCTTVSGILNKINNVLSEESSLQVKGLIAA